jgi:hypothetical protein
MHKTKSHREMTYKPVDGKKFNHVRQGTQSGAFNAKTQSNQSKVPQTTPHVLLFHLLHIPWEHDQILKLNKEAFPV